MEIELKPGQVLSVKSPNPSDVETPMNAVRNYLEIRDNRLQAGTTCRDTHEGCEQALRDVYLLACGEKPEHFQ